jgi:hypothetical protein
MQTPGRNARAVLGGRNSRGIAGLAGYVEIGGTTVRVAIALV